MTGPLRQKVACLRAITQIGQISKELEKSEQSKGGRHLTGKTPTKTEQLAAAGLNPMTANRYEQLAAPDAQKFGEQTILRLRLPGD